jgi:hypothetical protein
MSHKIKSSIFLFSLFLSLFNYKSFSQIDLPNADVYTIAEKNRLHKNKDDLLYVTVYKWLNDRWKEKGRYECSYIVSGELVSLIYEYLTPDGYYPAYQYLYEHDSEGHIIMRTYQIYSSMGIPVNIWRYWYYYSQTQLDSVLYQTYSGS